VRAVSGCWEWRGDHDGKGYGVILVSGRAQQAHRAAYRFFCGPIPEGLFVCHHCDNPPCCNPVHLFLGAHADNMRDMALKGRAIKRISVFDVLRVRVLVSQGIPRKTIAEQLNISLPTICEIVRRRTRRYV